jgi:hypothetical protein
MHTRVNVARMCWVVSALLLRCARAKRAGTAVRTVIFTNPEFCEVPNIVDRIVTCSSSAYSKTPPAGAVFGWTGGKNDREQEAVTHHQPLENEATLDWQVGSLLQKHLFLQVGLRRWLQRLELQR